MRYFLELSYRGSAYCGWQWQPNAPSVQQWVEQALSALGGTISITGAGRTDTGVHAAYYVAHFDCVMAFGPEAVHRLNAMLPEDIAVLNIRRVADSAHARFDAVRREYKYYLRDNKNPFTRDLEWQYYVPLDVEAMNVAAGMLLTHSDFTTFSKLHSGNKTNLCRIDASHWERNGDRLIYTIAADRFLRNMVRSLVAAMVDVGRGKITADRFGEILRSRDRSLATGTAPARGLFLTDVVYPAEVYG
ncbi:MAG: tRNA pseudouridine(38-40) synthase TruA [Rikenellaceae bacterium]|jgi:tRNA pseudouridine38-40 synthase|nr:tRNA pseudouridine(38-40) synthase TruA [Rikenellaceae bacterium]